jgi:hypothetical protein
MVLTLTQVVHDRAATTYCNVGRKDAWELGTRAMRPLVMILGSSSSTVRICSSSRTQRRERGRPTSRHIPRTLHVSALSEVGVYPLNPLIESVASPLHCPGARCTSSNAINKEHFPCCLHEQFALLQAYWEYNTSSLVCLRIQYWVSWIILAGAAAFSWTFGMKLIAIVTTRHKHTALGMCVLQNETAAHDFTMAVTYWRKPSLCSETITEANLSPRGPIYIYICIERIVQEGRSLASRQ